MGGSALAMYNLCRLYGTGACGVEENAAIAKEWYAKAAAQGVKGML